MSDFASYRSRRGDATLNQPALTIRLVDATPAMNSESAAPRAASSGPHCHEGWMAIGGNAIEGGQTTAGQLNRESSD
jgi:hypothetical protein